MVITVTVMGMMQVSIHQVTDMISMRNSFVATAWAVNVICIMTATLVVRCAICRIRL